MKISFSRDKRACWRFRCMGVKNLPGLLNLLLLHNSNGIKEDDHPEVIIYVELKT